jgi:hypothetical protein
MDRELREITKAADAQGWHWQMSKGGHVIFFPPDKQFAPIVFAGTPSDHRSRQNSMSRMKRSGFIWPWPERRRT